MHTGFKKIQNIVNNNSLDSNGLQLSGAQGVQIHLPCFAFLHGILWDSFGESENLETACRMCLIGLQPSAVCLYTGLLHQRGTLDVIGHLQTLCDDSDPSTPPLPEVLFLMPCHSTPFYSHIHCPMKMRFLECPPDLTGDESYVDEAERFFADPHHWLRTSFPYKSMLPTHLVFFDVLEMELSTFLDGNRFMRSTEIFHTHVPEGRVGKSILVYQRH